jgi:hypothetical protein
MVRSPQLDTLKSVLSDLAEVLGMKKRGVEQKIEADRARMRYLTERQPSKDISP